MACQKWIKEANQQLQPTVGKDREMTKKTTVAFKQKLTPMILQSKD